MRNPETILDLLIQQADLRGSAPAMLAPGRQTLTYEALRTQVERTGAALAAMGIGRGTRVALTLPNGPETAVLTVSVMAWATCAPLNPTLDPDAYELLLRNLRAGALIAPTGADTAALVVARALGLQVLRLSPRAQDAAGTFELRAETARSSVQHVRPLPGDIAFVLHTSGTTSKPKAVPLSQIQAMVRARAQPISDADRCLCVAPLFTDSALAHSLLGPLRAGASIGFASGLGAEAIVAALGELEVTYFSASPTVHASVLEVLAERKTTMPSALRFARSSSSSLPAVLQDRVEIALGVPVIQGYGMTESGAIAQNPLPPKRRKPGSVGTSVGPQIAIIDEQGVCLRPSRVGEVVVRGPGVMTGYENNPEANRHAFHEGWFRTGDLGYLDEDGYLFLSGRLKELINRGGLKVSPTEVDAVLLRHPAVLEAATFAVPHPTLGEDVAAAVVLRNDGEVTAQQLREFAIGQLAPYMVPSTVVLTTALAKNALGKVARSTLADTLRSSLRAEYVPPRDMQEELIAKIVAEVLHLERVGAYDNFFELGGDSLRGMQIVARVNSALGLDLPAESLFRKATVAEFAFELQTALGDKAVGQAGTAERMARHDTRAALSFAQQRLWLLDRLLPDRSVYNVPQVLRLTGTLDVPALARGVDEIVRRHEVLRTRFGMEEGAPGQVIAPKLQVVLAEEDLRALPEEAREAEAARRAQAEAQAPFDLERGPLIRVRLLRLGETDHWLLLTLHHIVTDGWSSGVLARELSVLYAAYRRGEPSPLAELPMQYADYGVWQREWLQREVLEQQLAYWKPALAELPVLELPTDRPRPLVASYRGGRVAFEIDAELTRELKALGRREGATLFMTLLAAFQVLLHRYSGQDDIAVGIPIAGRVRPELEWLIGFFVNTLVMRGDLSGEPSFQGYLARVRARALEAYAHQDLPFEKLVEELAPKRDLSRNPLSQVLFNLANTPSADFHLPGLTVQPLPKSHPSVKFDLAVRVQEISGRLHTLFEYSTDLFDASTIERMVGHWQTLLEGIVADPGQAISHLPLLTAAERQQLLVGLNDTAADFPKNRCVHELFEAQVARSPEAVALVFEDRRLTYGELNARANRLAHHLISSGVGPGALVGLCVERSLEMIVVLLGILKTGGAYVPLDPTWPPERARLVMEDAGLAAVVTRRVYAVRLPSVNIPVVFVDSPPESDVWVENNPDLPVSPTDLVYVLYTSGTTGRPKGVLIEHRQLLQYVWAVVDRLDLSADGNYAMVQPLTVDSCQTMIFPSLGRGGTLHLISEECALDATKLAEYFRQHHIDYLKIAPSHLAALLDQMPSAALLPSRALIIGGEASHWDFIERLWSLGPRCTLWNHYGPTETTVGVSVYRLDPEHSCVSIAVPIGRPLANVQYYILDQKLQPVPFGVPGELCIGGDQVARGYLHRPELTADRFVPDPFGEKPNARLYRSGDQVRYLADGQIEFLGRNDQQVKIRGFRIELGEIEAVLRGVKGVRAAAVLVSDTSAGGKRLVAFVVPDANTVLDDRGLKATLALWLPDYMIPSQFVLLSELPLTPHGKVDRKALKQVDEVELAAGTAYIAPRTPMESGLVKIWKEVLGVTRVGVHDNFFELGGHSLLAMHVISCIISIYHREISLRAFFETPTVAGLAEAIDRTAGSAKSRTLAMTPSVRQMSRRGTG